MRNDQQPLPGEMMNADDVQALIKNGRNQRLDWLADGSPVESIAQMLTSMANGVGGRLLVGVTGPSGMVIGVRDPASTIDRVMQASLSADPPLRIPVPQTLSIKEKVVVIIDIPEGMPNIYAIDGRYVGRSDGEISPLALRDIRKLLFERGIASFETESADGATLADIDWVKARAYSEKIGGGTDVEKTLLRRGCLTRTSGTLCPTNAGILLFGVDPQAFLPSAELTAVRFAGETMSDTFSRQDLGGTLPDQIRRAETFLRDHLRKAVTLGKTMARSEDLEYPLEAARELVVNAVAHRDYSIAGDNVRLYLFANRLEVTSPGRLPGPVTLANIREARFSRNPVIVQVLADLGFIERLGYGIDRVIALMEESYLPAPEFAEVVGTFCVRLHRGQPPAALSAAAIADKRLQGVHLNPRQEAALMFLNREGNQRITNSNLQSMYPDVHPETIRRDLSDLVTKDFLEKHGQKRGSYYILKPTHDS
ncbi:MAG: putative DNA binding domain-containing protein [Anaerolineae bacterium]|nr:putative DNA binding domain-containing protein [Anaerolineae bacterium]